MAKNHVNFSGPKDESLEAFKAWIKELTFRLTGKKESTMTEAQWEAKWKEFWKKE